MDRFTRSTKFSAAIALTAGLMITSVADAQIGIGPFGGVSIRGPFVGIDVLPYGGGTRVRAPFTSVNTGLYGVGYGGFGYRSAPIYGYRGYGGYGYSAYGYNSYVRPYGYQSFGVAVPVPVPVPVYPDPYLARPSYVYPEPMDAPEYDVPGYRAARPTMPNYGVPDDGASAYPAPMSTGSLEDDLRSAADRLTLALATRPDDADVWLDYLKPDLIVETIDRGGSPAELKSLLLNYEGLTGNSQLSAIWVTDGFRQTHRLLRQWIESSPSTGNANRSRQPEADKEPSEPSNYEDPYADMELAPRDTAPRDTAPRKPATRDTKAAEELPAPPPRETDL
jgi:hypothetical protein